MDESYIKFDRAKLKDVVHYICRAYEPAELRNAKLHKALYFADMLMFRQSGRPLSGVDYIKQSFGPTARHLTAVLLELEAEGKLKVESRKFYGFRTQDYNVLIPPESGVLSNSEITLLNDVISFVCGRASRGISELSHDAAWQMADIGERIPYAAVMGLAPVEYTEEDRRAAMAEAHRLRPLIERERNQGRVQ